MGNLIFCKEKSVRHPYYVTELGLHLYSGEELSYFLYNNLLLIPENFFDDKLSEFLGELGKSGLAERVKHIRSQLGFYEALYLLIQELRYYSGTSELSALRRQLDELMQMPEETRLKAKGDYLFRLDRYYSALNCYDMLLTGEQKTEKLGPGLCGEIWYDKGCCYARMADYPSALPCFLKAFDYLKDTALPEKIYALSLMSPELKLPKDFVSQLTKEQKKQYKSNYEERRKLAVFQGKALEAAVLEDKAEEEKGDAYLELLHRWKTEYRRKQNV